MGRVRGLSVVASELPSAVERLEGANAIQLEGIRSLQEVIGGGEGRSE